MGEFVLKYHPIWDDATFPFWPLYLLQLGCAAYGARKAVLALNERHLSSRAMFKPTLGILFIVSFIIWFLIGATVSFGFTESINLKYGRLRDILILGAALVIGLSGVALTAYVRRVR